LHGLPFGHQQPLLGEIKGSFLIMSFLNRGEELISQAKIQGQPGADAEIVLHIKRVDWAMIVHVMQAGDFAKVRDAQQKGSKG
jgi:hypothetical protein